jgi:hypothetical protein
MRWFPLSLPRQKLCFWGSLEVRFHYVSNEESLNALQTALVQEHRYTIVRSPADAELSGRIALEGASIKLSIFDTKTGMLLWTLSADCNTAGLAKQHTKKLSQALSELTDQIEVLAAGKVPEQRK